MNSWFKTLFAEKMCLIPMYNFEIIINLKFESSSKLKWTAMMMNNNSPSMEVKL